MFEHGANLNQNILIEEAVPGPKQVYGGPKVLILSRKTMSL